MDASAGSFVAVRRLSGSDRAAAFHHSSSAEVVTGSSAWIGRGLSCVCAQRRDSDARLSFDLTPTQEECLQRLQNRIEVQYDSANREHQVLVLAAIDNKLFLCGFILWYLCDPMLCCEVGE